MSEQQDDPNKPANLSSVDSDVSVSQTQGKILGRRAVLKAVLATTPVVMTIKSRPASAQELTPSQQASARLSPRLL